MSSLSTIPSVRTASEPGLPDRASPHSEPAPDAVSLSAQAGDLSAEPVDVLAYQSLTPEATAVISGRLFLGLDARVRIIVPRALLTIDASYYAFRRRWLEAAVRERLDELAEVAGHSAARVLVTLEWERGWWGRRWDSWAWRRGLVAARVSPAVPLDRRRRALRSGEVVSALVDPPLAGPGHGSSAGVLR